MSGPSARRSLATTAGSLTQSCCPRAALQYTFQAHAHSTIVPAQDHAFSAEVCLPGAVAQRRPSSGMRLPYLWSLWLFFLVITRPVSGVLKNVTVDDADDTGIVQYSPLDQWRFGPTCDDCVNHLDTSELVGGTWHASTFEPGFAQVSTMALSFTGSAVYIFNVLSLNTHTDLTFTLDDAAQPGYTYDPGSNVSGFQYNVNVFAKTGLSNNPHTLVMQTAANTPPSLILFDYAIYTTDGISGTPTIPGSALSPTATDAFSHGDSAVPVGPLVGGIVGGLTVFCLVAAAFWFLRRRKRRSAERAGDPEIQTAGDGSSASTSMQARSDATLVVDAPTPYRSEKSSRLRLPVQSVLVIDGGGEEDATRKLTSASNEITRPPSSVLATLDGPTSFSTDREAAQTRSSVTPRTARAYTEDIKSPSRPRDVGYSPRSGPWISPVESGGVVSSAGGPILSSQALALQAMKNRLHTKQEGMPQDQSEAPPRYTTTLRGDVTAGTADMT